MMLDINWIAMQWSMSAALMNHVLGICIIIDTDITAQWILCNVLAITICNLAYFLKILRIMFKKGYSEHFV